MGIVRDPELHFKKCRWCGKKGQLFSRKITGGWQHWIGCINCGCKVRPRTLAVSDLRIGRHSAIIKCRDLWEKIG